MKKQYLYNLICLINTMLLLCACRPQHTNNIFAEAKQVGQVVNGITSIMIHDVTNPPLAARFFSYSMLAGYEVVVQNNSSFKSFYGVINGYPKIAKPAIKDYSYQAAALFAMLEVSNKMQPSGELIDTVRKNIKNAFLKNGMEQSVIDSSLKYGKQIAESVIAFAKDDGYRKISNYKRYTPKEGAGYWVSTPPAYITAVEPYFNMVKPFFIDSLKNFCPIPPVVYSTEKNSKFYQLTQDVYNEIKFGNKEHKEIASFWDCNPFALIDDGHLQIGVKKISPGAHWMGITSIACKQKNLSFDSTVLIHTLIATTLMDAFICCWDEKFRSNRIRPETAIRRIIDPMWSPMLQTPPFPEYPSGHSVVSSASATLLSHFFGNNFSYKDDVELPYGLPIRKYSSFTEAANEAAISRFYGGIHYMDAIENGVNTGNKIGSLIWEKFNKAKL